MDAQVLQQKMREKVEDHQQQQQRGGKEGHQQQQRQAVVSSSSSPPPSASSSPNHEFSFTISLHQPSTTLAKPPPPSIAVDLSPADDIFFHGHLLPLHLLSHLPVSPRSSTNSLDSFTLPIKELLDQNHHHHPTTAATAAAAASETKERPPKSKSFSLFGLSRWKSKGFEDREKGEIIKEKHNKRKARFDLSHVLKRYMRMIRPLLSSLGARRRENDLHLRRRQQPYSFSGNLTPRGRQELRGRRGDQLFSAPASMRTSPTNSGLLVATSGAVPTSTSDSTMEELQAAIQAAIAHCKNSIAMEDKIKC